jgi:hypothetical protein
MLMLVVGVQFLAKTGVEIAFTPITYKVIKFLKSKEKIDFYDNKTNFNPFTFKG